MRPRVVNVAVLCMGIYMLRNEWNQYFDLNRKKYDMDFSARQIRPDVYNRSYINKKAKKAYEQKKIVFKESVDNSISFTSLYYKNSRTYKSLFPKKS